MKSKTKTTYIGFKCAPEQKEQIISKCRKYGLSMSEFIRVSCVRSSINIISGIPELTIELSRIGKNFNQIVRAVYLHPQSLKASELARIADDLDAIKDLITELKENTIHADH